jgi:hypothetical protein
MTCITPIRQLLIVTACVATLTADLRAQQAGAGAAATMKAAAPRDLSTLLTSLPSASAPVFDPAQALWLATMPLACIDRPHAPPATRGYLWEATYRPPDDYQRNLAFYGCYDWHSSVNSMWTLVRIMKSHPDLPIAPLIKQKLSKHLDKSNLNGELAYLKTAGPFERPYGYAWILKLTGEINDWKDPEAQKWAANIAPLAEWTSKEMVAYFKALPEPNRGGAHQSTSYGMYLMLDYLDLMKDEPLRAAIVENAMRFYRNDKNCDTKTEPAGTDYLSPCLTEAALMSRIMERQPFLTWLDGFLPAMYSPDFKPLTEPVDTGGSRPDRLAGKSHLIGLAFQRGQVMYQLAEALPRNDQRATVLRRLAAIHGVKGMIGMHDAGYYGTHWIHTYVVMYMMGQPKVDQGTR